MTDFNDKGNIIITGHLLIRDTETGKVLLSKSESSLIKENNKSIKGSKKECKTV